MEMSTSEEMWTIKISFPKRAFSAMSLVDEHEVSDPDTVPLEGVKVNHNQYRLCLEKTWFWLRQKKTQTSTC